MKRQRGNGYIARGPKPHVTRFDIAYNLATISTREVVTLFTDVFPGTMSIKRLSVYAKPGVPTAISNYYDSTKFILQLGLNKAGTITGDLNIPASDSNSAAPVQQNSTLWCESGVLNWVQESGNARYLGNTTMAPLLVVDFKKLKRRVDVGDFLFIQAKTDGILDSTHPPITFGGCITFYMKS